MSASVCWPMVRGTWNLPWNTPVPPIKHGAFGDLAGRRRRRAMAHMAGKVGMESVGAEIRAVQCRQASALLMGQPCFKARDLGAEGQCGLCVFGLVAEINDGGDRLRFILAAALQHGPPHGSRHPASAISIK